MGENEIKISVKLNGSYIHEPTTISNIRNINPGEINYISWCDLNGDMNLSGGDRILWGKNWGTYGDYYVELTHTSGVIVGSLEFKNY